MLSSGIIEKQVRETGTCWEGQSPGSTPCRSVFGFPRDQSLSYPTLIAYLPIATKVQKEESWIRMWINCSFCGGKQDFFGTYLEKVVLVSCCLIGVSFRLKVSFANIAFVILKVQVTIRRADGCRMPVNDKLPVEKRLPYVTSPCPQNVPIWEW